MDPAARLADYLAGQLDPDEHAAFEAELARDAALRADLDAMRAVDDHLAMIPAPRPPEGFEQRLDAVVNRELAVVLGPASDDAPDGADELAARRDRTADGRGLPRWVTAVSGAAAALVVLAGAGVVLTNVLGGDDRTDDAFQTQSLDAIEEEAFDEDAEMTDDAELADGPLLLAGDRSIDDEDIQALLEDQDAFGITARDLDAAGARDLAAPFAEALGAGPADTAGGQDTEADEAEPGADDGDAAIAEDAPDATAPDDEADDDQATEEEAPSSGRAAAHLRLGPDVSAADRAQVSACLQLLLSDTPDVIPTYAELVVFEGEDAIVFGLISEDPGTGRFTRREAWVVDRDSCEVRLFTQQ